MVRPTSETIINEYFSKWVQSYRDLPLLINQWANVVRWEMRPRIFLRTTEFLWQEGHTAHATDEEARDFAAYIHREVYADFMVDVLGIDVVLGRKTPAERFAGAVNTLTLEAMMRDGKALQMGTSHEPRHQFRQGVPHPLSVPGRAAGVRAADLVGLLDPDGRRPDHGPRRRPRAPRPAAARPVQAVVLAVKEDAAVLDTVRTVAERLRAAGVRTETDDRTDTPFGRRAVDWELKGVPLRIEIGPRDLASGTATLVRRIPGGKEPVPVEALPALLPALLEEDQAALLRESRSRRESATSDVTTEAEAVEAVAAGGWARIAWSALGPAGEARLAEHGVSVRCLVAGDGSVPGADDEPGNVALVARAY